MSGKARSGTSGTSGSSGKTGSQKALSRTTSNSSLNNNTSFANSSLSKKSGSISSGNNSSFIGSIPTPLASSIQQQLENIGSTENASLLEETRTDNLVFPSSSSRSLLSSATSSYLPLKQRIYFEFKEFVKHQEELLENYFSQMDKQFEISFLEIEKEKKEVELQRRQFQKEKEEVETQRKEIEELNMKLKQVIYIYIFCKILNLKKKKKENDLEEEKEILHERIGEFEQWKSEQQNKLLENQKQISALHTSLQQVSNQLQLKEQHLLQKEQEIKQWQSSHLFVDFEKHKKEFMDELKNQLLIEEEIKKKERENMLTPVDRPKSSLSSSISSFMSSIPSSSKPREGSHSRQGSISSKVPSPNSSINTSKQFAPGSLPNSSTFSMFQEAHSTEKRRSFIQEPTQENAILEELNRKTFELQNLQKQLNETGFQYANLAQRQSEKEQERLYSPSPYGKQKSGTFSASPFSSNTETFTGQGNAMPVVFNNKPLSQAEIRRRSSSFSFGRGNPTPSYLPPPVTSVRSKFPSLQKKPSNVNTSDTYDLEFDESEVDGLKKKLSQMQTE